MDGFELYKDILDQIFDGIYIIDTNRKIVYWNKSAQRISGYKFEEVVGKHCHDNILVHTDKDGNVLCNNKLCPAVKVINGESTKSEMVFLKHKDGHRVPVFTRISPMLNNKGKIMGAIEIFTDNASIIASKNNVEKLVTMALVDSVTGIRNRRSAENQINLLISEVKETSVTASILKIEIDNFYKFKEEYGESNSDRLLGIICNTIKSILEKNEMVFRWGESSLIVICRDISLTFVRLLASKIKELVKNSYFEYKNKKLSATVSISGVIVENKDNFDSVMEKLDRFMALCIKSGGNTIKI